MTPSGGAVKPGDVISCTTMGNPEPQVTVSLDPQLHSAVQWPKTSAESKGSAKFVIPGEAEVANITFLCEAENAIGGEVLRRTFELQSEFVAFSCVT